MVFRYLITVHTFLTHHILLSDRSFPDKTSILTKKVQITKFLVLGKALFAYLLTTH